MTRHVDETRPSAALIVAEPALLACWDAAWMLIVLSVTGAFGGGLGGWVARAAIVAVGLLVASVTGSYRPSSWLRGHHLELILQLLTNATVTAWAGVVVIQLGGLRADLRPLLEFWLVAPIAWYVGRWLAARIRRHRAGARL